MHSPYPMLIAFAVLSPCGVIVAVTVHDTLGGLMVLSGLLLGAAGLHRLGRSGPDIG